MKRTWEATPSKLVRLSWAGVGFVGIGTVVALAPPPLIVDPETGLKLSDVKRQVVLLGMPVHELGIVADPQRPALMVVAQGCHSCDEAEAFFKNYKVPGLRTIYLGTGPEGTETTNRRDLIQATPIFLFFDDQGKVKEERKGWSSDADWQRRLLSDIETVSVEASTRKLPSGEIK